MGPNRNKTPEGQTQDEGLLRGRRREKKSKQREGNEGTK